MATLRPDYFSQISPASTKALASAGEECDSVFTVLIISFPKPDEKIGYVFFRAVVFQVLYLDQQQQYMGTG